jgi:hypothetical protein
VTRSQRKLEALVVMALRAAADLSMVVVAHAVISLAMTVVEIEINAVAVLGNQRAIRLIIHLQHYLT